jgi:formylglycine-generating enzyme required for sulfatase activity
LNYCDASCPETWSDASNNDGYPKTAPTGSYSEGVSWCGALDLSGNASEWVADWFGESYYASSPRDHPQGPSSGDKRALRGGDWYGAPVNVRSSSRGALWPDRAYDTLGFRCTVGS